MEFQQAEKGKKGDFRRCELQLHLCIYVFIHQTCECLPASISFHQIFEVTNNTKTLVAYKKIDGLFTHSTCLILQLLFFCFATDLFFTPGCKLIGKPLPGIYQTSWQWGESTCRPGNHTMGLVASGLHHFCLHLICQNNLLAKCDDQEGFGRGGKLKLQANNIIYATPKF